ncbi:SMI1/KNR4 family protein [Lysinibacillus sp. CTST325]
MKQIVDSILKFIQTMNKYPQEESPVVKSGGVHYRSELVKLQVDEKIYLSPELKFFYEHCEIICDVRHDGHNLKCTSMDVGSGLLYFWSPENLVYRQEGFRWIGTDLKEDPEWNPFRLVIADINDAPVVVVTDKEGSPVMASYETGALFPIANTFSDFLDYLSITLELIQGKYNGEIIDDESCELLEGFIADLKEILSNINNNDELVENFIDYLYG